MNTESWVNEISSTTVGGGKMGIEVVLFAVDCGVPELRRRHMRARLSSFSRTTICFHTWAEQTLRFSPLIRERYVSSAGSKVELVTPKSTRGGVHCRPSHQRMCVVSHVCLAFSIRH